jgi:hypothetical protein
MNWRCSGVIKIRSIAILPIIVASLTFSACTHIEMVPEISLRSQGADYTLAKKIDLSVNLCITEELKTAKWEKQSMGDTFITPIGHELAKNSSELANILFEEVVISSDGKANVSYNAKSVDAILTPRAVAIEKSRGATAFGDSIFTVALEWKLQDIKGNLVWVETINGEARTTSGNIFTAKSYSEEQFKMLFKDLFTKSFLAIRNSPEISKFVSSKLPDRPNLEYKSEEKKPPGTLPNESQPSPDQNTGKLSSSLSTNPSNQSSEPLSKLDISNKATTSQKNSIAILPINASKNFHGIGAQYYTTTKVAVIDKLKKLSSNNQEFKYIYNHYDLGGDSSYSKLSSEMLSEDTINTLWARKSTFSDNRELNTDYAIEVGKKLNADLVFTCDLFGEAIRVILIDVSTKKMYQKAYSYQTFGGYTAAPNSLDDFLDKYRTGLLK